MFETNATFSFIHNMQTRAESRQTLNARREVNNYLYTYSYSDPNAITEPEFFFFKALFTFTCTADWKHFSKLYRLTKNGRKAKKLVINHCNFLVNFQLAKLLLSLHGFWASSAYTQYTHVDRIFIFTLICFYASVSCISIHWFVNIHCFAFEFCL